LVLENVTGINSMNVELVAKRLGLLQDIIPERHALVPLSIKMSCCSIDLADVQVAAGRPGHRFCLLEGMPMACKTKQAAPWSAVGKSCIRVMIASRSSAGDPNFAAATQRADSSHARSGVIEKRSTHLPSRALA
jgi:hypothetical protein